MATFTGTPGDDTLSGTSGNDILNGLAGNDQLSGLEGADLLLGGEGQDSLFGGDGQDSLVGGNGPDSLVGGDGQDTLLGGDGQDTLQGGAGKDTLDGGLLADSLEGGDDDDVLRGGAGADTLRGGAGNDTLSGDADGDDLDGGAGDDVHVVDSTSDVVSDSGTSLLDGVVVKFGNVGGTPILLRLTDYAGIEILDLQNTGLFDIDGRDPVNGVGSDFLFGNGQANTIRGLRGDDVIQGRGGDDSLSGGGGDDSIQGNDGGDTLDGGIGDDALDGGAGVDRLTGGDGDDSYVVDTGDVVIEAADLSGTPDVVEGGVDLVSSALALDLQDTLPGIGARFANVERGSLLGQASVALAGNALGNELFGNAGANRIDGRAGADTMAGGAGNDTYFVDDAGDLVTENAGGGIDTLIATIAYTLPEHVENISVGGTTAVNLIGNDAINLLTGNDAANLLEGRGANDSLTGGGGDDTLDGGSGVDRMIGGTGDDAYRVDTALDVVQELLVAGGTDRVESAVSWTLGANLEKLLLLGALAIDGTGNTLGNELTGNDAANRLLGQQGSDLLTGAGGNDFLDGGIGTDTLVGGDGDDTYVIDTLLDVLDEAGAVSGPDGDTLRVLAPNATTRTLVLDLSGTASIDAATETLRNLAAFENVEVSGAGRFRLVGDSGANRLVGNAVANRIDGDAGDDLLVGNGGADSLFGGEGSDTYRIDALDILEDTGTGGSARDVVEANFAIDLQAVRPVTLAPRFGGIEDATLVGATAGNLSGTAGDNILVGSTAANRLDGRGGEDTLRGGLGADTYIVDHIDDDVEDVAGPGIDLVESTVSFTLGLGLDNLTLKGTDAIDGTGNALRNVIIGNVAANAIDGGAGIDVMIGGAGNDTYVVDAVGDVVTETVAGTPGGTDLVRSAVTFVLGPNVEKLELTGGASVNGTGNGLANELTGNTGNNALSGGLANDTLAGGDGDDRLDGGAGIDDMAGGLGSDTFLVDAVAEFALLDDAGGDHDTVLLSAANASATVTRVIELAPAVVTPGAGLEVITLSGIENVTVTGTGRYRLAGNDADNVLTGNAAANLITGGLGNDSLTGGLGIDTLEGGAGSDTYGIDATDLLADDGTAVTPGTGLGSGERDVVQAAFTVDLTALRPGISVLRFGGIDDVQLTGTAAVNALGNAAPNLLTGNGGVNRLEGRGGNDRLVGGGGRDVLVGGEGDDTYVIDALDVLLEATVAGGGSDWVESAVTLDLALARFDGIENALLTGIAAANLTGDAGANQLTGNAAANRLDGAAGADTMTAGAGNDTYRVDALDTVVEADGGGTDLMEALADGLVLPDFVEQMLLGTGVISGTGNALDNLVTGNAAANRLDGEAGADTMVGGANADTYVVDSAGDVVTEAAGGIGGPDLVEASVDFVLGIGLEDLRLTGTADLEGDGNALANVIQGNAGANRIDGAGGADSLSGAGGNDTLAGEDGNDELRGEGDDDSLSGGIGNDTLSGGIGDDSLSGGADADFLDGDAGVDTLAGGAGNDTLRIDADDVIEELAGGGVDTVLSSATVDLGLARFDGIENVVLEGSAEVNVTGDAGDNRLEGNGAANRLDGAGGTDVLAGGGGDDSYRVDAITVQVLEADAAGTDTVESTLAGLTTLWANVENLLLLAGAGDGTGNGRDNFLEGNDTANTLRGLVGADSLAGGDGNDSLEGGEGADTLSGGAGLDTLTGGDGADRFRFDTPAATGNADTVSDFTTGVDGVALSAGVFEGLGAVGAFDAALLASFTGSAGSYVQPTGASQRLAFNTSSGELWYDADGNGAGDGVLVATLFSTGTTPAVLAATDILVVA